MSLLMNDKDRIRSASVLRRLGRFTAERSRFVIVVSVVLAVLALVVAAGTIDRLVLSRFESPGSESLQVGDVLSSEFDTGKPHFLLLVTANQGTVDDPQVVAAGEALTRELAAQEGVAETASYWSRGNSPALRSDNGQQALIVARLGGDVTQARTNLAEISPRFTREGDVVSVQVGGGDEVFRQAAEQAREDFILAELIIVPLLLIALFFVYRRFSAAALTLGMGLFSVAATLALLRGATYFTDISTFAANLSLVMGLGLGVDYSLFIINRFREELRSGRPINEAVSEAVATAGRTVIFSGITVAVSLVFLLLFPFPFLRSFAYTGVAVVSTSIFAAVVVLPAALARLGKRADLRNPARSQTTGGGWRAIALRMMRRPVLYGGPALLLLLVLGSPVLGLNFGLPDDRVLPESTSSRVVAQQIRDNFSQEEMDAIQVVTMEMAGVESNSARIERYAIELSRLPGIAQVDALTGSYQDGQQILPPNSSSGRFAGQQGTWFSAVPTNRALEGDVRDLVDQVRSVPASFDIRIGGYPAELSDFRSALIGQIPLVFGLILVTTFVILFLMTGSLLLPAKATVLNILSMSVMFGALVWIFQEGHLSDLLGFTATGSIEPTIPILMFCIAFGLSMDYEVFMMSRIKEEYDRTGDNTMAVVAGLERSGPLITAAAIILALSFATYAVSGIVYLRMLAVGMALVILVDATLIRAVLVPVFMRLAGRANWWAPQPLRRVHQRFGINEA
jgi:putative drug exporter of the RND superfamily